MPDASPDNLILVVTSRKRALTDFTDEGGASRIFQPKIKAIF
jgi:hypothetical protein